MDFEKIEQAYTYLLENVQVIQSDLTTNFYDALVEQNSIYLDGETELNQVKENNQALKRLALLKEEWLKTYQFLLMKAGQTEPLQANHQFTPDAIALLLVFIVEELFTEEEITILEMGSGMGILGATFLTSLDKKVDYLGMEVDDLLIDLAASMADVIGLQDGFVQGDAVRPQMLKESDVVISDLPVGYYPDDAVASRHQVASSQEYTYAHHLFMEQGLKYLKLDGYAIFLAPSDLLTSPQSDLLKGWLKEEASLVAMISLPENLFANVNQSKTIFILQKKNEIAVEPFVYPLASLQDASILMKFKENFQNWSKGTEI
ncbi:class I SAM-dependent methyltransferase [Streptococcus pseudopneumoniae]|uniref:class I SAM-dependent methyltransferase n=1 Tax=Streptococcus pseudopneumoniae TaxID=257758 RepID=UPI0018B0AD96|nr:class I SAM-dependent methyltransferase [Streptococcus pseudopneumoniae]MBF9657478.1 class I SAM-dependent methyltransferase [Streptococcus pseudopneumoniae]